MTSSEPLKMKKELQDSLDILRIDRDFAMRLISEEREKARRRLEPIHELRARQAFRRQVNPCPGGAC